MYPHHYATRHPDRPAIIMAESGETITYAQYEARSNQLAHYLRANGLAGAEPLFLDEGISGPWIHSSLAGSNAQM